ncbi:MAG: DUF92 domain-containing protein [Vulcanimicrobiaceae bacterium]
MSWLVGVLVSTVIVVLAVRANVLSRNGAVAAIAVGTATIGGLGFAGAIVLLTFFVTSVALSRVGRARKRAFVDVGKLGARDSAQVLANGAVAAVCALAALSGDPRATVAFAGAFAAATADTWGTEIGTFVGGRPRSILSFRPVATGLSGGITVVGTLAEIGGALLIAATARLVGMEATAAIFVGGLAGALADSVLGASVQSLRWCPACRRPCEVPVHSCGVATTPLRGLTWFGNDAVNLAATVIGAAVAATLAGAGASIRPT